MALDLKQMERDILEEVRDRVKMGSFRGRDPGRWQTLYDKYPSEEEQGQVRVLIDHLVEKRYLSHFPGASLGDGADLYIRGITTDGMQRLRELQSPGWTWLKRNGFAVAIAMITAGAALGSIIVDATCNRG